MDPNAPRVHPQQALAVYVESLAVGRRVAVFGDSSVGLAGLIASLGARSVHVWDPDVERARFEAAIAPSGVVVRGFHVDDLDPKGSAFDLAVVADLELFDDAEDLLARIRRLVGEEGAALVASPNREADAEASANLDYYELFDLVAREFADVKMIAILPFRGVAIAELGQDGDDSPAVCVDTQLADVDRAPDAFLALASQRGVRLDPYTIIELAEPRVVAHPAVDPQIEGEPLAMALAQRTLALRAAALEGEIEKLLARVADAESGAVDRLRLESALLDRSSRVAELESALAERVVRLGRLSEELERIRAVAEAGQVAMAQLEALGLRADRAERDLQAIEPELARVVAANAAELARYEDALRERAQAIRALETELVRRERMIQELVGALDETSAAAGHPAASTRQQAASPVEAPAVEALSSQSSVAEENVQLRLRIDALALELARREGEAQATAWTVAELESRLQSGAAPAAIPAPPADDGLAAALDELDALRRALAQEHGARLSAESGEELAAARAEIQRQAVLLEQLRSQRE